MAIDKAPSGRPIRILAIEDEELLREYMCDFLEDKGYITLQAPNGRIGIEMVRSEHPDLVLTDLRMPEMNGLDVLAAIQAELPDLPVIVISGTGTLQDVIQSMKFGAWDYILKPVHDNSIIELSVNRVLERKRLIDENKRYREHLEEEVVKRSSELLKSTLRFKSLFNLAGDMIFVFDKSGNILETNEQAARTFKCTLEEVQRMKMWELFDPAHIFRFEENLTKVTAGTPAMFESVFLTRQGVSIPVEVNACAVTMEKTQQVFAICRDISERKKAEKEQHHLEQQLFTLQKMEIVGSLASGIAHDFNNILTALNGYASLMRRKLETEQESCATTYLEKINEIIAMGKKLTGRITNFIRKDKEELVSVDVHTILEDTVDLLHANCQNITIGMDCAAENSWVLGDESQLQNAFLNLGLNARDAMPDGGKLHFSTSLQPTSDKLSFKQWLVIQVTDTGTGMPAEIRKRIFEPLFTTKEKGKGTGLGLTSVLCCIKNLHGDVDVESTPGNGTVFTLRLPLIEQPEAAVSSSQLLD